MATDDRSSAVTPGPAGDVVPTPNPDPIHDAMLPPGTGRVVYAYYLRQTRALSARAASVPVWLMLAAFVAFVVTGPTQTSTLILLAIVTALGAVRIFLHQPREDVGVALTETHVVLGRFPSDTRTIGRERIASCITSDRPWSTGDQVPPAAASFLVNKLRYLTITCDDGVAYNVAYDASNIWADHLCDVLGGKVELTSPTRLVGSSSRKYSGEESKKESKKTTSQESLAAKPPAASMPTPKPKVQAPEVAQESAEDVERRLWFAAVERHDDVLGAYFPYESDPHLVLTYPAVSDITVPATAGFFDALGETTALRTESYPGEGIARAYRDSVKALASAWAIAERNAKRAGTSLLEPADRRRLDQATKLLRHADSSTSPHERASYLRQVKTIVDDLVASGAITTPPRAMMEIERATARAIEAARLS